MVNCEKCVTVAISGNVSLMEVVRGAIKDQLMHSKTPLAPCD